MKKIKQSGMLLLLALSLLVLPGCYDQITLEQVSFTLMIGLDLDDQNHLVFYHSSPLFSKESKEFSETVEAKAYSLNEARDKVDATLTGLTMGGKNQTILLGKRVIDHYEDWVQLFDVFYRNPKLGATNHFVLVDGPVKEVFEFKPKDKPSLPIYMDALIETTGERNLTVSTDLQEFRRQLKDKGITPAIPQIRKVSKILEVTGTSLLHDDGHFAASLSLHQSALLLMLQHRNKNELSFSVPYQSDGNEGQEGQEGEKVEMVENLINKVKTRIKTRYKDGQFQFDVNVELVVDELGRNFELDLKANYRQVEQEIAKEMHAQLTELIQFCQSHAVDPIGFGLYARAYEYEAWKGVQDHWAQAFASAKVNVQPVRVMVESTGVAE